MNAFQSFNVMFENMLLDCIFLHILLDRTTVLQIKKKYKYSNSMTSSKSTKLSENIDMGDVISSLESTHIKSEFCRRRMTCRIPCRRQWGLPSENAKWEETSL
jgi:hypothetical protein